MWLFTHLTVKLKKKIKSFESNKNRQINALLCPNLSSGPTGASRQCDLVLWGCSQSTCFTAARLLSRHPSLWAAAGSFSRQKREIACMQYWTHARTSGLCPPQLCRTQKLPLPHLVAPWFHSSTEQALSSVAHVKFLEKAASWTSQFLCCVNERTFPWSGPSSALAIYSRQQKCLGLMQVSISETFLWSNLLSYKDLQHTCVWCI